MQGHLNNSHLMQDFAAVSRKMKIWAWHTAFYLRRIEGICQLPDNVNLVGIEYMFYPNACLFKEHHSILGEFELPFTKLDRNSVLALLNFSQRQ